MVAALHKPSGRQVAIKKVLPFEHTLFCLRTLRELKLLRFFSETCVNENVSYASCQLPTLLVNKLMVLDYLHSKHHQTTFIRRIQGNLLYVHLAIDTSPRHSQCMTVIQELMQTDLHRVIRTQKLTDDHCQVRPQTTFEVLIVEMLM